MPPQTSPELVDLFRRAGVGWYMEQASAPSVEDVEREAAEVSRLLEGRLKLPPGTVDVLREMLDEPERMAAFVQTFAIGMTPEIRAMVRCVVRGAIISSLRYEYKAKQRSELHVTLQFGPNNDIPFSSTEHWDAEVLRHLGFAKIGGRPLIDGYFAFRR
jgi:hypothetical protein